MGTDIHMAAEVRINGEWRLVKEKIFLNPYYVPNSNYAPFREKFTNDPYSQRNYNLFAILADVRNGYGFAGCLTGEEFVPISYPKGYPEDMSEELKSDIDDTSDWDEDRPHLSNEHSGSWLTLKELLDYDWSRTHRSFGYVTEKDYVEKIKHGEIPDSWSGGISGPNIVTVDSETMDLILSGKVKRQPKAEYYIGTWFESETYAKKVYSFYTETIPTLKKLIPEKGTAEDVRLVFDFDS